MCWSTGPTDPTLSKSKKIILQNVDQLAFFQSIIFCFLKKKEIKHNKHINNQNQEVFIVIVINYTFSVFLLCLLYKIIFFKKILTLRIKQYYFYFANRSTLFFSLSCPQTKKINLVSPNVLFLELILCTVLVS